MILNHVRYHSTANVNHDYVVMVESLIAPGTKTPSFDAFNYLRSALILTHDLLLTRIPSHAYNSAL